MSDLDRRLAAIAGEDEWTRHRTLEELRTERLSPSAIRDLARSLADDDATTRTSARMALAAIAAPESASRSAAQSELRSALAAELENVRVLAATALGEAGDPDAGDVLVEALSDPSSNVAAAAADALGELRYAPALEALGGLCRTGDRWVRQAGVVALGRLEDERAIPVLDEMVGDRGLEGPLIEALSRIDDPSALPVLERLHDRAPGDALRAAGRVLATHPDTEPPEWVASAARGRQEALRSALLEDDDPATARLIGLTASPGSIEFLMDLLGPPRRSEAAIAGLLAVPPELRAPAILDRLETAGEKERVTLLSLLPPLDDESSIRRLVPLLEHDRSSVRGAAAEALARADPQEALPLLTTEAARNDAAPEVIRAVGSLGQIACASLLPLLRDPSASVRAAAAGALLRCPGAAIEAELRAALEREEDLETRDALLLALVRSAGGDALDVLDPALNSDRLDTRLAAIEGLGFTGDQAAVPRLRKVLDGSRAELFTAIRSLGRLGLDEAAPVLASYLDAPDQDIRRAAAGEVVHLGGALEAGVVERMATDEDPWVRTCAVRILSQDPDRGRAVLERLAAGDSDPAVRSAARSGLGETP